MKTTELMPPSKRYGVTEKKKAELDHLSNQVLDAQYDVEQQQAVVTSLTSKSEKFQAFLTSATSNQVLALSNKNMLDEIVTNAKDLQNNSGIAFDKMVLANGRTKEVAIGMKGLIDKLIYSAEIVDKLANLVIRQKALNPLISDELVAVISDAGKDANNAVALTLVALSSTFVAQAGTLESEAAAALECMQSMQLYEILAGKNSQDKPSTQADTSLAFLISKANDAADEAYKRAKKANDDATKELNKGIADLTKAQNSLKSLQAGLAAANAAAMAS
jgi:hypothetical protein